MVQPPQGDGPLGPDPPAATSPRYCFDTDALISLFQDGHLPALKRWAAGGFLVVPMGVLRELKDTHGPTYDAVSSLESQDFR